MDLARLRSEIEALHESGADVRGAGGRAVDEVLEALDTGTLRVCELVAGVWQTHAWVKRAILLYFRRHDSVTIGAREVAQSGGRRAAPDALGDPPTYFDKLPTKRNYERFGARCVPPGVARYGSYLGRDTILMPGFVNVGAYVDDGSMIDTWATVGSCAQIGKNVHLSGGVGIGGVLEPPQAQPVIVEDGAFVGSRCVLVEGVFVGTEAVLGAGLVLTASTPIIDVRTAGQQPTKGRIEPRSVVIPGSMPKTFTGGTFGVPCALVIGERTASTNRKTSLEAALRAYGVAV